MVVLVTAPTFAIAQEGASMGLVTQPTTALVGEHITHKILRALVFGHNPIPCQRTVYQTDQKRKFLSSKNKADSSPTESQIRKGTSRREVKLQWGIYPKCLMEPVIPLPFDDGKRNQSGHFFGNACAVNHLDHPVYVFISNGCFFSQAGHAAGSYTDAARL